MMTLKKLSPTEMLRSAQFMIHNKEWKHAKEMILSVMVRSYIDNIAVDERLTITPNCPDYIIKAINGWHDFSNKYKNGIETLP